MPETYCSKGRLKKMHKDWPTINRQKVDSVMGKKKKKMNLTDIQIEK